MPKNFSLHKRGSIYYAQLWNPITHRYSTARSTGSLNRDDAVLTANKWLHEGLPDSISGKIRSALETMEVESLIASIRAAKLTAEDGQRIVQALRSLGLIDAISVRTKKGSEGFIDFLRRFWNYDESLYIKDKLAHGQRVGKRHAQDMTSRVKTHWEPFFRDAQLCDIDKKALREFSLAIAEKNLAASTINKTLIAGTTALRWAFENDMLQSDPSIGLLHFSGKAEKRGILEPDEVVALFKQEWNDRRAYVANLTASTTGLRMGEILALQARDIGEDRLYVRHSWGEKDGLKTTKNGDEREVPLLPMVRDCLLDLVATGPYSSSDSSYVFYGASKDRPMPYKPILKGLKNALIKMSLGESEPTDEQLAASADRWRSRGIDFHSWRHWYAKMMTDQAEFATVQKLTGHRDHVMLEHYADHKQKADFEKMGSIVTDIFGKITKDAQKPGTSDVSRFIEQDEREGSNGRDVALNSLLENDKAGREIGRTA